MASTDEHFKILTEIVKSNPKGLCALSEVMQSHMKLSIEPRLSDDPLTALSAVMRNHNLIFEFGRESDSYSWIYLGQVGNDILIHKTHKYRDSITADYIKPEK